MSPAQKRPPTSQPNIIIIFSDDAGYADFGFNGSNEIKTPNIDALASQGIRFSNGYVSGPVCSPSRAGLLTGKYQERFGHETNLGDNYGNTDSELLGLPVSEKNDCRLFERTGVYNWNGREVAPWRRGTVPSLQSWVR